MKLILILFDDFLRKFVIGFGAFGFLIKIIDGLSVAGRFGKAHGAGDDRLENLLREVFLDLFRHFLRKIEPAVVHRE